MQKDWVRVVFRRRIYIITIILVQIGFILSVIAGSSMIFQYVSWFLNALSIVVCLYILNKKKKPAYKLTWIFLILLFPIFGGFLYIVFHAQSNSRKLQRQIETVRSQCRPFYIVRGSALPQLIGDCKDHLTQVRYLQHQAGYPVYAHTQTEYFKSGESFFVKVLEELEKAERYIFMEFFILRQGIMLNPIIALLEKKAEAGLDVRLMYDDLGCFMSLPPNFKLHLEGHGIKCIVFNPFKPILSSLQNNRDHRKIIVIDGKVAFTGGVNLADEYINALERFGHWKDAAVMLCGEAAWSFTLIFLQMWNLEQQEKDDYQAFYPWKDAPCTIRSDGYVQPYADNPIDPENVVEHVYIQIINQAKEYVYISTPYLVVDDNMVSALTLAAKSGVDVRIITPHRWDKKIVAVTSRSYYRQLVSSGVKVYEYTNGFNHSKTFVSDDTVASVGTANLDFRSLYLHFECGVCIYKNQAVESVKQDFLATLPICHRITLEDCARNTFQQLLQDVLRLFAPFM
ncbi:MAG: cardiolipin synthase [Treponema sp.]|jgi:cardiolipin synthase|nr:cardiolipin synthase [Treponema sp.]